MGFDAAGKPKAWPMRLAKAHWAALLARLAGRRIHAPLPHHRREGPGPADAAAVQEVRPLRHRECEDNGHGLISPDARSLSR